MELRLGVRGELRLCFDETNTNLDMWIIGIVFVRATGFRI